MQSENGDDVVMELSYLRDRLLFLLWRLLRSRVREAAAAKYTRQVAQAAVARAARTATRSSETAEQRQIRQREQIQRKRAYAREMYVNSAFGEHNRRPDRSFGAVNTPAQLEALAYRYFVGRFGSPLRRHRRMVTPYNGSGGTFVARRRRETATVTAVDPVTALNGRLTALDDMHYRAAITVARLEQTVQPS